MTDVMAGPDQAIALRGSWYRDGDLWVVVLTGMPEDAVEIGIGNTVEEAWTSREDTAIQSVGRDSGEDSALSWAHVAGWFSGADLEPADVEAGAAVDSPIGEVSWSDDTCPYVACVYDDGNQPGDCYVRVGEDEAGVWWIEDGDDDVRLGVAGPYHDEDAARAAAEALAAEQHKGEEGEGAESYLERTLAARAGEPTADGEWGCYWSTVLDDSHVEGRYATQDAAEAAAEIAQRGLEKHNPGGGLQCGYEVRRLVNGEWVESDFDRDTAERRAADPGQATYALISDHGGPCS